MRGPCEILDSCSQPVRIRSIAVAWDGAQNSPVVHSQEQHSALAVRQADNSRDDVPVTQRTTFELDEKRLARGKVRLNIGYHASDI